MNPQPEKIHLQVGEYTVCAIPTGEFGLDGGSMFGTVPKVLWERTNPADSQNRIPLESRSLLLKSNAPTSSSGRKRNILIDCGNGTDFTEKYGPKLGPKFSEIYNVDSSSPVGLLPSLQKHGLKASDITDVVLTHLHFDHCGGGVCFRNGKLEPTFENAKYYVQKANFETATHPNIRERASYLPANFEVLQKAGVLELLDPETDHLPPGLSPMISNGHTQGHQMIKVSGGGNTLVYCGDVVPTSTHVRLAWVMGYDLSPLTIIEEKKALLTQAASQNWYLYFEHDPFCDAGLVSADGPDFKVSKRVQFSA